MDAYDRELAGELQSSLPDNIFDMHAHPFLKQQLDIESTPILGELPRNGGIESWKEAVGFQVGEKRLKGGLFFGLPILPGDNLPGRIREMNIFIQNELEQAKTLERRGLMLISHLMEPSDAEKMLSSSPLIAGFKPYMTLNPGCTFTSDIPAYLPEWALELANQKNLVITLHIIKPKALSDDRNIKEIKRICKSYPSMKLVLAHCGCGFNMYNTINGIRELAGIENLWFDTSAVCEAPAIMALLRKYGPKRLMWGTDYPISVRKGKIVTMGDMYFGIQNNTVIHDRIPSGCNLALLGLEQLRAMVYAISECGLKDRDVEDVFYNNAKDLLKI